MAGSLLKDARKSSSLDIRFALATQACMRLKGPFYYRNRTENGGFG